MNIKENIDMISNEVDWAKNVNKLNNDCKIPEGIDEALTYIGDAAKNLRKDYDDQMNRAIYVAGRMKDLIDDMYSKYEYEKTCHLDFSQQISNMYLDLFTEYNNLISLLRKNEIPRHYF